MLSTNRTVNGKSWCECGLIGSQLKSLATPQEARRAVYVFGVANDILDPARETSNLTFDWFSGGCR